MAYTGTGTQEDPYIVDNWADFKRVCSEAKAYIAFDPHAENKVIDLNETEDRNGLLDRITLFSHVEGNGWRIRNLVTNGQFFTGYGSYILDIRNLHFENVISTSSYLFTGAFRFTNCTFSGLLLTTNSFLNASGAAYADNCAFRLHCLKQDASATMFKYYRMTQCSIHLTGKMKGCVMGTNGIMQNCSLSGTISLTGGTFNLSASSSGSSDTNNAVTLSIDGTGTVTAVGGSGCILDKDLISDDITLNITSENWHLLTTSQMQDAEYLMNTVGFPCVEVTA